MPYKSRGTFLRIPSSVAPYDHYDALEQDIICLYHRVINLYHNKMAVTLPPELPRRLCRCYEKYEDGVGGIISIDILYIICRCCFHSLVRLGCLLCVWVDGGCVSKLS